jgi:hypothetical protein
MQITPFLLLDVHLPIKRWILLDLQRGITKDLLFLLFLLRTILTTNGTTRNRRQAQRNRRSVQTRNIDKLTARGIEAHVSRTGSRLLHNRRRRRDRLPPPQQPLSSPSSPLPMVSSMRTSWNVLAVRFKPPKPAAFTVSKS